MSHWYETSEIVAALREVEAAGGRAALATVVAIEGSSYRRPGAKLLVRGDGPALGGVSGGCLEADVREVARAVLASGRLELRVYDSRRDGDLLWGLGTGCSGRVEVLVQPAIPGAWSGLLGPLAAALAGDAPFALATPLDGKPGASLRFDSEMDSADSARSFVERFEPPTPLVVCGAGDDSEPLVRYATQAGFRVFLVDHRAALLSSERFPFAHRLIEAHPETRNADLPRAARAMAVVKMHAYAHDRDWARRFLAEGTPFVGLLGPRERQEKIRSEIAAVGDERLVGPVGLDLGAEGAHEIAISVVAQLLAFRSRRRAAPLALRLEPIHAD